MDASALVQSLDTARTVEASLLERLGVAIQSGDEDRVMALQRELREAEGRTAELSRAAAACEAAVAAAERDRLEREAREAREARAAMLAEAREAHADLLKKAAKIDKVLAALDDALKDMADSADAFAAKFQPLGLRGPNRAWLTSRTWVTEVVHRFRYGSHSSLTGYLGNARLLTYGAGKPIAKLVPAFEGLVELRPDDVIESEREPA